MRFRRVSNLVWSVTASLFAGPVFMVLVPASADAGIPQVNAQVRDSIQLTAKEWEELEDNLRKIPYYIFRIERPRALALIRAGLEERPSGAPWGTFAVMLCSVDGEQRRQLSGEERVTTYRESLKCLQSFHDVASAKPTPVHNVDALEEAMAEAAVEAGDLGLARSLAFLSPRT